MSVVTAHLVGNAVPREVRFRLLDDRDRIAIVELAYFPEVSVVFNDNRIDYITDAEQISAQGRSGTS